MTKITTLGIDLAKHTFQVASFNPHGKLLSNRSMSRSKLKQLVIQHPPCLIGLEACASSHYWARFMTKHGHKVKQLPPAFVKGFTYGNKHDANDAKAIGLAIMQPEAPVVQVKTPDQLNLQAQLRIRDRRVRARTQCANQIRSLLYEHGILINQGIRCIRKLDVNSLPQTVRSMMDSALTELTSLDQLVTLSDQTLRTSIQSHPTAQRLMAIPGFGPINTIASVIINPQDFKNGRHYAAYLGLVPKQTGTGGKTRMLGVSKRGNTYQRKLLGEGASAYLHRSKDYNSALYQWSKRIQQQKGSQVAVAALANKLARISWCVLSGQHYQAQRAAEKS